MSCEIYYFMILLNIIATLFDFSSPHCHGSHLPIAQTPSGDLRGSVLKTWTNKEFYSFRGIPFAEPPVGSLRFKAPVTKKPWQGIKNATEDGKVCPQIESNSLGPADEDCLYLNVYTKQLNGNRPVIVFFHPGGFFLLTGASYWAGPQYLMNHDIVLVTANYRLDALGFLSTGDKVAVGNYAMKDQVEVLRWIQKHIRSFGGNPNKVTLAGYSAGSTSGFLHMLSPMSRGLFHSVIAMSCGVTSDWIIKKDPKDLAVRLAKLFNCSTDSSEKIVECLKTIPANEVNTKFNEMRIFAGNPVQFSPVIEHDFGTGEERFLTDNPTTLIKKKEFYQVPVVMGIAEHEFLGWSLEVIYNDTLREELINNFDYLAPIMFSYTHKEADEAQRITNSFKKFYFDNKPIKKDYDSAVKLGQVFSDSAIIYDQYSTAKLLAKFSDKPVYFYILTYKGRYGYSQNPVTNETVGPCHMDDQIYLLHNSKSFPLFKDSDPESFMVKIETSIWKNFAANGNPTPDKSPTQWLPVTRNNIRYLKIDKQMKMEDWSQSSLVNRMNKWESLLPV